MTLLRGVTAVDEVPTAYYVVRRRVHSLHPDDFADGKMAVNEAA